MRRVALAGRALAPGEAVTRNETTATPVGGSLATTETLTLQPAAPEAPTTCQVNSTIAATPEELEQIYEGLISNITHVVTEQVCRAHWHMPILKKVPTPVLTG